MTMRLEDATKEELIWWIREHSFDLSRALVRFGTDIMLRRSRQHNEKAGLAGERYSKALKEYCELLGPYRGKPMASIPGPILKRGAELEEEMTAACKEQRRHWAAADKCLKRM